MIKSFFLTAIRNLWKNRATSVVKMAGLAIGLSAILLIYLYVSFEYSYDSYHENSKRIYRVAYRLRQPNMGEWDNARTGHNLASMLQDNFPEIETTTRVTWMGEVNILHKNRDYKENMFLFADPSILTVFSFPMKRGDRYSALNDHKSVIISSRIARKYFGNEDPLGKYLDDNLQLKITGVADVPDNSHFRFDILASYSSVYDMFPGYKRTETENIGVNVYTYLLLKENAVISALEKKMPQFTDVHVKKGDFTSVKLFLEPLEWIHFNSQSEAFLGEFNMSKFTKLIVYLFEFLGIIILSIACFNFINIAVAQIVGRTKEVGVRKVYGSGRSEIFFQFVCKYWVYAFVSIIFSVFIVQGFLPLVSAIFNRQIQVNYFQYVIAVSVVLFLITILAGAYPSFMIARINPIRALQSGFKGLKGNVLRSVLVISQFSVSIILILITIYISKQINHLTEMDMGINTKNLLVVRMGHDKIRKNYELIKSELLKIPNILSVSASSNIPVVTGAIQLNVKIAEDEEIPFQYISVDPEFLKNFGIRTVEGESDLSSQMNSPSAFLLNKSAVEQLDVENPVGKGIALSATANGKRVPLSTGQIVGIIDNYSYRPNYEDSKGAVFGCDPGRFEAMFIRVNPTNQEETIAMVESTWKRFFQDFPFSVSYLEDEIRNDFFILKLHGLKSFIRMAALFSFLIALLGLFGLSLLTAKQRIKEIGVRRVNGASKWRLLMLMNRRFMYMVILSIALSFPVVYLLMEELQREATKSTNLSGSNYGVAFLVIVSLSFLTVSWQSWTAATRNPVEALRYE